MKGLSAAIELVERGLVPDWMVRAGIRRLIEKRLEEEAKPYIDPSPNGREAFVKSLSQSPIALHPDLANEQHYEVPSEFFLSVLGPRLKYSCCYWPEGTGSLLEAEEAMLGLASERAGLTDGQRILELGCGWGSMTLWMAERYPSSSILAMSNSHPQREFIQKRAGELGLSNLQVVTCDINDFESNEQFDRVVSIEMFEHVRNYRELMRRIAGWLAPQGKLFVHIFCHRIHTYPFETEGADNWMGRHFFTGGIMPSYDLLLGFQEDLKLEQRWAVGGEHYSKTALSWLENLDRKRESLAPVLAATYGAEGVTRWQVRWRLFFMACEELFGYGHGGEWQVGHYLFRKP